MKLKKIALAVAAISMTMGAATVFAGELANEFGGNVSVGSMKVGNGASNSFGYGGVYYGRFILPSLEAKGTLDYTASAGTKSTGFSVGGAYYFTPVGKAGNAAFYVGGDVGNRSTTNAASQTTWDINGGMKYFLTDSAALDVKLTHNEWKASGQTATKLDMVVIGAAIMF